MSQITFHLPDETQAKLRKTAEEAGLSQDEWVAQLVEEKLNNGWPQEVLDLGGAWPDMPDIEEIRASYGEDAPREEF